LQLLILETTMIENHGKSPTVSVRFGAVLSPAPAPGFFFRGGANSTYGGEYE
jgi:hypothetical protein